MWKSQLEIALSLKGSLERELALLREDGSKHGLRPSHEHLGELAAKRDELEGRRAVAAAEVQRLERQARAKATADAEQAKAAADVRREVAAEVESAKQALKQVVAAAVKPQTRSRAGELQQELLDFDAEAASQKEELARQVQAELQTCEGVRGALRRLQADHSKAYRDACEGLALQTSALEGSATELKQTTQAEVTSFRREVEKLNKRKSDLQEELVDMQTKLANVEQEAQEGAERAISSKSSGRAAVEAREAELKTLAEEAARLRRATTQKADQLRRMVQAGDESRRKLLQDIAEAKVAKARQAAAAEQSMQSVRSSATLTLEDTRQSAASAGSPARTDGVRQESEQLSRYASEPRLNGSRFEELSARMQRSAAGVERRGREFRA